jgi:hypothetical protein
MMNPPYRVEAAVVLARSTAHRIIALGSASADSLDWEHHFEDNTPASIQMSREGLTLHLSEHHGDCCPGSTIFVWMTGIEECHQEITGKGYTTCGLGSRRYSTKQNACRSSTRSAIAFGSTKTGSGGKRRDGIFQTSSADISRSYVLLHFGLSLLKGSKSRHSLRGIQSLRQPSGGLCSGWQSAAG